MFKHLLMPRPVPVLDGALVSLRAISPASDAADYFVRNREPEMHIWTGNIVSASLDEAQRELERFAAMDDVTMWAIVDNASNRMIGRFLITLYEREGRLTAGDGIRLAKQFWRTGRTKDARRLAYGYAFHSLHVDCVETKCWTDNVNSRLSILNFGFQLVTERMEHNSKQGRQMNVSLFRLEQHHWHVTDCIGNGAAHSAPQSPPGGGGGLPR
jgi:RimJ/RimL family protein N-acetyltransferase